MFRFQGVRIILNAGQPIEKIEQTFAILNVSTYFRLRHCSHSFNIHRQIARLIIFLLCVKVGIESFEAVSDFLLVLILVNNVFDSI